MFIVDDAESLMRLPQRGGAHCTLLLPELTDDENSAFERRINKLRAACGCPEGAAAMLLAVLGYTSVLWLGELHRSQRVAGELGLGLALMITALVAGKAIGLLLARLRLGRAVRRIVALCESRHQRGRINP